MIDQLVETAVQFPGYVSLDAVATRYGIDPRRHSGEEYLHLVAQVEGGVLVFFCHSGASFRCNRGFFLEVICGAPSVVCARI